MSWKDSTDESYFKLIRCLYNIKKGLILILKTKKGSWKLEEKDYVYFYYLEKLIFIDFLYCNAINNQEEITVPWFIGEERNDNHKKPVVELRKSDREYSLEEFKPKVIRIPDYVEIIEAGVFDGLEDVVIKTSQPCKPEGWEDGWNGSCKVEWGVKIN